MKRVFFGCLIIPLVGAAFWVLCSARIPNTKAQAAQAFRRVIAMAPSYCETMVALGQTHRLVGISSHCEAEEAQGISQIGSFAEANFEAIMALKPDLVLAVPHVMAQGILQRLAGQNVAIFAHQPDSLADIKHINAEVGRLLGVYERGQALNERLENSLRLSHRSSLKRQALVAIAHEPLVVAGPHTFASEIINYLGLENMAGRSSTPWPVWSLEALLAHPPEFIIITEGRSGMTAYLRLFNQLGLDLARHGIKLIIPEHPIFASPSPRLINDIEYLATLLAQNP